MTKVLGAALSLLAAALPASAAAGAPEQQDVGAWQTERHLYTDMPGYERPSTLQTKVKYYMEMTHGLVPPERLLKNHPVPRTEYKGATVASEVDASFREINKFKAGLAAFEAELKAVSAESQRAKGDAPNRYLVGQGWKILKAMASAFNDELVPGANDLYQASAKGNQDLEILIAIAGGNNKLFDIPGAPQATLISGTQNERQLIEEVQREHDSAAGTRSQGDPLLSAARARIPGIYDMIEEYDKAYVEYAKGMSHMTSGAAKLAKSALHGLSQAVTTGQAASAALQKAEGSEQQAINAVRACTEGNLKALQDPGNAGAQASASDLNKVALGKVKEADAARQAANAILERPTGRKSVGADAAAAPSERVRYKASDKAAAGKAGRAASGAAQNLTPDRQPEPTDKRP